MQRAKAMSECLSGRRNCTALETKSNLANCRSTRGSGVSKQLENGEEAGKLTEASETALRVKALAAAKSEDLSLLPESCPLTFTYAHKHQVNK